MSHRWNCPPDYEARRQGERACEDERARSSNPYKDDYWNRSHDRACPEAAEEWDRGYRRAEMRAEEEREEEAARQRAAFRRAELEAEEAYYQQARDEEMRRYYEDQQEPEQPEPTVGEKEG